MTSSLLPTSSRDSHSQEVVSPVSPRSPYRYRESIDLDGTESSTTIAATPGEKEGKQLVAARVGEAQDDALDEMPAGADDETKRIMAALGTGDPFPEVPGSAGETQFTLRSLVVGCFCGAVIGASDLYLGLKSGNTIGGSTFGAIAGFGILQALAKVLPKLSGTEQPERDEGPATWPVAIRRFFKLGGAFGPKENVAVMCCATAAASNGIAFYGAIPALYQLHLLSGTPREDYGRLICLAAVCAYWGMFFSVPFRKLYVLDLKLPFPGATANAVTVRTLHTATGAANNKRRIRALIIAFVVAFTWKVISEYAPGLTWSHHVFWALYQAGAKGAIGGDNWTWYFQWSPAFLGVGMIIGGNAAASIALGQVLAWGIIGPALVATGVAAGTAVAPTVFKDYVVYTGVTPPADGKPGSPRYWLLWPGVLVILVATFTELACNGKGLLRSFQTMGRSAVSKIHRRPKRTGRVQGAEEGIYEPEKEIYPDAIPDPAPKHERIPVWVWMPGTIVVGGFSLLVMALQFGQNVGLSILAIFLALIFSFITCEGLGRLAVSPGGIASSLSQMILLGYSQANHYSPLKTAYGNTMAATITASASQQTGDMVTDLKVAHLLGASPKSMFYAQCVGAVVATFLSPSLYILFTEVYPCILASTPAAIAACPYQTPAAAGFRAIAGLAGIGLNIELSSGLFAIFLSLLAAVTTVAKNFWVPQRYHKWIPSWIAVGLGFLIPTASYCIAFGIGALVMHFWRKRNPMAAVLFAYPVAAGMISGEGIGGIMTAILQIVGAGGSKYGTTIGCPWGQYCG